MLTRKRYGFWIDTEQRDGLRFVKTRDGILESEQIRRAIKDWLNNKGVKVKSARKRARTRGAVGRKRTTGERGFKR